MTETSATVSCVGDTTTIEVSGYVSGNSAAALAKAFSQANADRLVLVFDEDSFIDSTGLAVLMELLLPAKEAGKTVRLVHPKPHFRRVFDIVGLSKDFEVFADAGTARGGW